MSRSEAGRLGAEKTNRLWRKRYEENPSYCKYCKIILSYEKRKNKFCNQSCAARLNNTSPGRRSSKIGPNQFCNFCDCKVFDRKNIRKYCSTDCFFKAQRASTINKIRCGEKVGINSLKRYLLESRGSQCEICGITEWCNQEVPLIMDHIDGNSANNDLSNLRLVCGNCDMQLPTYKSKNIGNGRHKRRKRYSEGKSY